MGNNQNNKMLVHRILKKRGGDMLDSVRIQNVFGDLEISSLRKINLFMGNCRAIQTLVSGLQLLYGAPFYSELYSDKWTEVEEKTRKEMIYSVARWSDSRGEMRVRAKTDSNEIVSLTIREVSGRPEGEQIRESVTRGYACPRSGFALKFLYQMEEQEYSVDCYIDMLGKTYVLAPAFPPLGAFSFKTAGANIDTVTHIYSMLFDKDKRLCHTFLSIVWGDEISDLRIVPDLVNHTSSLYIEMGREKGMLFPLSVMGTSIFYLVDLAVHLVNARNGIFVVDGIEEGVHSTELGNLWQAVATISDEIQTQVFAITYKQECAKLANQYFSSCPELFGFYQLS